MLSLETSILLGTVLIVLRYYLNLKWKVLEKWNIPHDPPSISNIGHVRVMISERVFDYELENKKKYGPIWGYYVFTDPHIVIHDLDLLEKFCIKEFSSFPYRLKHRVKQLNGKILGQGLLHIKGEQWKRSRKTLAPAFSSSKLRRMASIAVRCSDNTLDVLRRKNEVGDGSFDVVDVFKRLSLDVICSTAFSMEVNSQNESVEEPMISVHANTFFSLDSFRLTLLIPLVFPFLMPLTEKFVRNRTHVVYFKDLCLSVLDKRNKSSKIAKDLDLMQLMIVSQVSDAEIHAARKGLTRNEIISNAVTMLLAGYETTAVAMAFLAYNLAQHPEIQRQLQNEIDEMVASKQTIDFESASSLKFLDMCVNESLRLYCPLSRTVRTSVKEITLNGVNLPAKTLIDIPIYALCHDPEFWEDPMEFRPERMEDKRSINKLAFQPFGAGPRNCIGQRFAIMEIKVAFCKLLHKFTFVPTPDTPKPPLKLKFNLTTTPKENLHLFAVARKTIKKAN